MIKAMLIAGAGGFVGTCGRYLIGKWCSGMFHGAFPLGTFMVNIIGSSFADDMWVLGSKG